MDEASGLGFLVFLVVLVMILLMVEQEVIQQFSGIHMNLIL